VTAISIFNNHAGAEESNRRGLAWIEQNLAPLLIGPAMAVAGRWRSCACTIRKRHEGKSHALARLLD
jgi:hypothetical protein